MSVKRTTATQFRTRKRPYFVADSKLIEALAQHGNAAAIGMWVYLANKDPGWIVCRTHLENLFGRNETVCKKTGKRTIGNKHGLSRDGMAEVLKVLRKFRVLRTVRLQADDGRLSGSEIVVSNEPIEDEPQDIRLPPPTDNTDSGSVGDAPTDNTDSGSVGIPIADQSVDRHIGQPYPLPNNGVLPTTGETTHTQGGAHPAGFAAMFARRENPPGLQRLKTIYQVAPFSESRLRALWHDGGHEAHADAICDLAEAQMRDCFNFMDIRKRPAITLYVIDEKWNLPVIPTADTDGPRTAMDDALEGVTTDA